jgi:predicted polyphosphate/ATP-dependent NAD kinase
MNEFLQTNPGLKSRFERTFVFEDYKPEELILIADKILKEEGLKAEPQAREHLAAYFTEAWNNRNKFFGNAREVRKVIHAAIKNQHLRMADMESSKRTVDMITALTLADVAEFTLSKAAQESQTGGRPLGFRVGGNQ